MENRQAATTIEVNCKPDFERAHLKEPVPSPVVERDTDREDFWTVIILLLLVSIAFSLGYLIGVNGTGF